MDPRDYLSEQPLWPCFAEASYLMVTAAKQISAVEIKVLEAYQGAADEADRDSAASPISLLEPA